MGEIRMKCALEARIAKEFKSLVNPNRSQTRTIGYQHKPSILIGFLLVNHGGNTSDSPLALWRSKQRMDANRLVYPHSWQGHQESPVMLVDSFRASKLLRKNRGRKFTSCLRNNKKGRETLKLKVSTVSRMPQKSNEKRWRFRDQGPFWGNQHVEMSNVTGCTPKSAHKRSNAF